MTLPLNWPSNVEYLTQCIPSKQLPLFLSERYCSSSSSSIDPTSSFHISKWSKIQLHIQPITVSSEWDPNSFHSKNASFSNHPALGEYGLFAQQDIPPNTFLRPYFGIVHFDCESNVSSEYDLTIEYVSQLQQNISIDATLAGGQARFVNDYRSISSHPNCLFETWQQGTIKGIGIWSATKPIKKGQELTISYGKGFWKRFQNQPSSSSSVQVLPKPSFSSSSSPSTTTLENPIQAMLDRQKKRLAQIQSSKFTPC